MNIHELDSYRLSDAIKFNDQLNPRIWGEDEHLLPDVRDHLLAIADDFREFLGLSDIELKDITISGSNAAYTYTPHSDIDLHLVVDLPEADRNEVYRELFDAKKYQYNDQHNFKIGGYDVELYVQNANEPPVSQGEYSVLQNKWLQVPKRQRAVVDDMSTQSKYEDLGHRIESAIADGDRERMEQLAKKIREMRTAGLADTGEFGPENLAFKLLRANGLIDQLRQARLAAKDRELSLNEREKNKPKKIYGYKNYWFPGYEYYAQLSQEVDQPGEIEESAVVKFKNGKQKSLEQIVEKFTKFVCQHLHIKTVPTIKLVGNAEFGKAQQTMGHYVDDSRLIEVQTAGRHVLDILRTLAHELVHYSQHEKENVPDTAGDTGSPWENEANSVAGVLMRYFNRAHPEYFETKVKDNQEVDEGIKDRLAAAAAAACIAGSPGCATTQGMSASDAVRGVQNVGRTVQTIKNYGRAGAEEELMQQLKNELRRQRGQVPESIADEDYDPNGTPPGPEFKPTMPAGTARVDVSDVYDWYKLGQHISNLKGLGHHDFGKGAPSTIIAFGSEEEEHKYIKDLEKTGLTTTDIDPKDPNPPKGMKKQKTDPTYNVNEATGYIPVNSKEAQDPRYEMAITVDIKPGEVQRQARKMGFKTTAAGIPPTLNTSGKLAESTKLKEIERISKGDYAGGKDYLGTGGASQKQLRPLPGGSRFLYSIQSESTDVFIKLWDPKGPEAEPGHPQIIGKLTLEKPWDFPIPNAIQVNTITTDEDYRGRGLAKAMYGIVLTILKRPLVAGGSQTPGGRQNWVSLAGIPGVEMKGYVAIDDEDLNPNSEYKLARKAAEQRIDTIMGKLGGDYIGESQSGAHYFAFDVKPTTRGNELEAYVKQNLARVYNENYNTITGLYAVWSGK